ncbi:AMP-binding protein [Verrucomicrobiota bacterium]
MDKTLTREQLIETGLTQAAAREMTERVNPILSSSSAGEAWNSISRGVLRPDHPFETHRLLHETVFSDWDRELGPAPAWFPSVEYVRETNIAGLIETLGLESYAELHSWSVQNRAEFWRRMVGRLDIRFSRNFTEVVDMSLGVERPRWFPQSKLNIVDSCFTASNGPPAIVFQAEGSTLSAMSRSELVALTNRVGNGLMEAGFMRGDAVAIDMPMTAESVAIYLGIVKAGCVAVSIADSFASQEIEKRLRLGRAKGIFTQEYMVRAGKTLPLYERVVAADAPRAIVLPCPRTAGRSGGTVSVTLRDRDLPWSEFLSDGDELASAPCSPDAHTNVLFSSGTTGDPKAIPWTHTTPVKCAADGHLHHDIRPGDVVAWPTNLGWMMGPWLIYASLINGATIALYDGTPTGSEFGRFVQDSGVTMLGVVPSLVRAWRRTGCMKGLDWRSIRAFSSTGECSSPDDMLFLMSFAEYRPIIEYCGGTEIGGGHITGTVVQPAAPATFSTPALGIDFVILDDSGLETDNGELFLVPPSIGLSTELLNEDHHQVYFDGTPGLPPQRRASADAQVERQDPVPLRRHGDQVEALGGGYFRMHGRTDDTMNLRGVKVSSAEVERMLSSIEAIQETAAIAVPAAGGGPSRLVIYAVLAPDSERSREGLKGVMQRRIRQNLNPLFKIHDVVVVDSLPRTASNKVMRRVLRDRYADETTQHKQV